MRRQSEEFGAWVRRVKGADSLRQADLKTGVSYTTISNMELGKVPEMETVVKFARGYQQDANEALTLAGYDPLPTRDADPGTVPVPLKVAEQLADYLTQQSAELGLGISLRHHGGEAGLEGQDPEKLLQALQVAMERMKSRLPPNQ